MLRANPERTSRDEGAVRKRFDSEDVESELRFRLLVDSVRDYAIYMLDPDGYVRSWNTGAERLKGYTRDEILGRHFSVFYPPERAATDAWREELETAARDGRFEEEDWRVRKDGTRFWANVVLTALRDPDGRLVGFAKVTRDLTDRVRAEAERARSMAMEEAARKKDDFLAIMGHELRNPLAAITTASNLIRLRNGRATDRELAILDRQTRHMTRLVDDLLDASRALREKVELLPRAIALGDLLANAVELSNTLIEQRSHELRVDVPDPELPLHVDPERMAQVLGNLLSNAAKYTPEGGRIALSARAANDRVLICVQDNGQGIASDLIAHVFELFVQAEQGLERKAGGLGIGLAVAKRLVEAHGGEIFAESKGPGFGSRFTVVLPLAKGDGATRAASEPPQSLSPDARRVLVVDDNADTLSMMHALLAGFGHDVRSAADGETAITIAKAFEPHIVLLDIGLPGVDGYQVASTLRALPCCGSIPIVALSGYARESDRARAFAAGFSDHLAKPVDFDKLQRMVSAAKR